MGNIQKQKQDEWKKFLIKMVKAYEEQTGYIVKEVEIRSDLHSVTVVPHAQEKNGKKD